MTGSGDVLRNFNADGLDSLYPRYAGGICRSSRWASGGRSRSSPSPRLLSTAAVPPVEPGQARRFPGRRGDRRGPLPPTAAGAAAGRRASPFRLLKTWKTSADPHHAARRARVEHLYTIADGQVTAGPGDPVVIRCVDEFGPLNLPPRPAGSGPAARAPAGPGRGPAAAQAGYLSSHRRGAAPVYRPEAGCGQDVPARKETQETRPVPGVLPLPARPPPAAGTDRDRLRQLRRAAGGRRFRPDPDIFPGHRGRCGGRSDAAGALGSPAGTTPNWTSTAGALVMRPMVIVTTGAGPGRGRHRLGAADTPAPGPPPGQWAALAGSCFAPPPRRSP